MRGVALAANDRDTLRLVDARIAELQVSPELVMGEGLKALYERHDAAGAVQRFRRVLELQPSHYGASFQLAAALQAAGERDAARQAYQRSLQMAREQRDAQTVRLIEERLRQIGQ